MSLWGKTDNTAGEPKFTSHHEAMDTSNFTVYGVDTNEPVSYTHLTLPTSDLV